MNSAAFRIILTKIRWLAYETATSCFDFVFWFLRLPVPGMVAKPEPGRKRIVFVGELLPPRTPRMAKWLVRSGGFSAVLVCSKRGFVQAFSDPHFEGVYLFRNKWHLKRILLAIPEVYVLHSFAPKSYYPDIARQTLNVPFIHDMQDVYATYYGLTPSLGWLKKELPHEKTCLEKANGLVANSLEPNAAYRKYFTKQKPPSLFFPLYCDDDFFFENKKELNPEDIHIVYAGGVAGSHRNPKQYGNIQFKSLILKLASQQIHFHIYPSPSNVRADYEEYEAMARESAYFHFHEPVSQQKLGEELNKYHFGILPFFKELSEQSDEKLKYATTLKLFNYLESGIPVIVSKDLQYQSWMVKRTGSGFEIGIEDLSVLKNIILNHPYSSLKEAVSTARKSLSLKKQINRLIEFYKQVTP
jgi:hypothetical protein